MSSGDKEKSNTLKFSWILEAVTLLGIHTTPLWMFHLQSQMIVTLPTSNIRGQLAVQMIL